MIRNLIFDVGGVLQLSDHRKRCDAIAQKYGCSAARLDAAIEKILPEYDRGSLKPEEYVQLIGKEAGITIGAEEYFSIFFQHSRLNLPLIKLIKTALSKRFSLYIFSNQSERNLQFLQQNLGLDDVVTKAFYSLHYKVIKPEEQFYRILLEQTGIVPEETVFIDDRQENLHPASQLGFRTILFKSNSQLEAELRKLADF